jgi:hypothetical protein
MELVNAQAASRAIFLITLLITCCYYLLLPLFFGLLCHTEMRARAIMVKATAVKNMTSAIEHSNMLGAVTLYNSLGFKDKAAASLQMYEDSFATNCRFEVLRV